MSVCLRSAERLFLCFTASDLQLQNIFLYSCCRPVWQQTSLMWQNAADDYLRRRPTDQSAARRLEPCRTVTGRPGWPSWNPPDVEPEARSHLWAVALVWCGRNVERRTANVQPHSGQTATGSSNLRWCRKTESCSIPGNTKWAPGPASLRPRLTDLASGEWPLAGSSQCDTRQPPVQGPWPQQGHCQIRLVL